MAEPLTLVTGREAGLSGDDQIRFALQEIIRRGGMAETRDLYDAIESALAPRGMRLSEQGKASLRNFINTVAVQAGYVHRHDRNAPDGESLLRDELSLRANPTLNPQSMSIRDPSNLFPPTPRAAMLLNATR